MLTILPVISDELCNCLGALSEYCKNFREILLTPHQLHSTVSVSDGSGSWKLEAGPSPMLTRSEYPERGQEKA